MYFQPQKLGITNAPADYSSDPFIYGFELNITGNTTFLIRPGIARAYSSNFSITSNKAQFLDISTVGPLGCYPWALDVLNLSDRTSFNVYVIAASSGVTTLPVTFVVATGDNFLLPGYDTWRKIGTVHIDNSPLVLFPMTQSGSGNSREYIFRDPIPGSAYGPTTFFPLPLSIGAGPCNPFFTDEGLFIRELHATNIGDYGSISTLNTINAGGKPIFTLVAPGFNSVFRDEIWIQTALVASGSIVYITVSGAVQFLVSVAGWREYMGLQAI